MDQIEEVRSKIDIIQLLSEYIPLKKAGRNFKANCPFHSEKTASLMVSPERQIWKCFGCGKGGSVFNFVMEMERVDFYESLRILAKRAGVTLASYRPSSQEQEREKIYQINHLACEFYHYLLVVHPIGQKARDYLKGRGMSQESIKLFKLGYSPDMWHSLRKYLTEKKGYKSEELRKAGLITGSDTQPVDFFRDRLMFPLRNHRGDYVGFSGRVIGKWDEKAFKGPKYINTPETPVYQKGSLLYGLETNKESIRKKNQVVIVEGELDLISSHQIGIDNVVAIKGSALTEPQVGLLKRFCENVALGLDMDLAGDQAARRGIEIADTAGLNIRVIRIPDGKDPDELAHKDPDALKKAVTEAIPIYDFYIESSFRRNDPATPEGKRKIGSELVPIFSKIGDEIIKSHYVKELARKLGVDEDAILSQMEKVKSEGKERYSTTNDVKTKEIPERREVIEEYLCSLAFQGHREKILLEVLNKGDIKTGSLLKIVKILENHLMEGDKDKDVSFESVLPAELAESYNHFFLFDFGDKLEDDEWYNKELKKTIDELDRLNCQEKMKEISSRMLICENEGKLDELEELKKEFRKISQTYNLSDTDPVEADS